MKKTLKIYNVTIINEDLEQKQMIVDKNSLRKLRKRYPNCIIRIDGLEAKTYEFSLDDFLSIAREIKKENE